jgi:hypothetical protein
MNNSNQERVVAHIVLRVDPTLRVFLAVLSQQRQQSTVMHVQTILKLLQELRDCIEECVACCNDTDTMDLATGVTLLLQYLSSPLLVIFKQTSVTDLWDTFEPAKKNNADLILKSAKYQCVEHAARLWTRLMELIRAEQINKRTVSASTKKQRQPVILMFLVACANILPTGEHVQSWQMNTNNSTLDKGHDCFTALLNAVASSLGELVVAEDGIAESLVARIADSCVAALTLQNVSIHASSTLETLIKAVPVARVWQNAFPGCFVGLCKCMERQQNTVALRQSALRVVSLLLTTALAPLAKTKRRAKNSATVQRTLESLALAANHASLRPEETAIKNSKGAPAIESFETLFLKHVQKCIPTPLLVLMRRLSTVRSAVVRMELTTTLCRTILIDTMECWSADLIAATFETCLLLFNDEDADVCKAARTVLDACSVGTTCALSSSRLMDLMAELPPLAQSQRQVEFCSKIKLVTAYLQCFDKSSQKTFSSLLVTGEKASALRQSLIAVFDVKFESFDLKTGLLKSMNISDDCAQPRPADPEFRFLSRESSTVALECLRVLGVALGPKYTALFVDACIADMYEACVERVEQRALLTGSSQVEWLHKWIGSLVVVCYTLPGAFASSDANVHAKKRIQILLDLAASILPILTSTPLFDLPTSPEITQSDCSSSSNFVVASALRGNAVVAFYLLDIVGKLYALLRSSCHRFLPATLYSILEKTGLLSSSAVQAMAVATLDQIAVACGETDRNSLLMANADTLLSSMNSRVRVPGGSKVALQGFDDNVLSIASSAAALLTDTSRTALENNHFACSFGQTLYVNMRELLYSILWRFDQQAATISSHLTEPAILIQLLDASICNLLVCYNVGKTNDCERSSELVSGEKDRELSQPWLEWLKCPNEEHSDTTDPEPWFISHHQSKSLELKQESASSYNYDVLNGQTQFVSDIASRSCYLLSHPSLMIQIQSTDVLIKSFSFLGWVLKYGPTKEDEPNGPSNAIFRQVHASWPAISSRIIATTSTVTYDSLTSLQVVKATSSGPTPSENIGQQRIFLGKLFNLVAIMCECSDDFMISRWKPDVWPAVARIVKQRLTQHQPSQAGKSIVEEHPLAVTTVAPQSERRLLNAVFDCLSRVFGHLPTGRALSGIIPTAGTMLLPFLEDPTLEDSCVRALKCMICINSDGLWRQLIDLSGLPVPRCPLLLPGMERKDTLNLVCRANIDNTRCDRMTRGAYALLEFIDTLPEATF